MWNHVQTTVAVISKIVRKQSSCCLCPVTVTVKSGELKLKVKVKKQPPKLKPPFDITVEHIIQSWFEIVCDLQVKYGPAYSKIQPVSMLLFFPSAIFSERLTTVPFKQHISTPLGKVFFSVKLLLIYFKHTFLTTELILKFLWHVQMLLFIFHMLTFCDEVTRYVSIWWLFHVDAVCASSLLCQLNLLDTGVHLPPYEGFASPFRRAVLSDSFLALLDLASTSTVALQCHFLMTFYTV